MSGGQAHAIDGHTGPNEYIVEKILIIGNDLGTKAIALTYFQYFF